MREIKFRAWSIENQEMTDADSLAFDYYEPLCDQLRDSDEMKFMQFTGLKDVNGNEIYEGDIVQVSGSDGYYVNAKVIYECGAFWFYAESISMVFSEDCDKMVMLGSMYIEYGDGGDEIDMVGVVGNIHQHPELLEGDK